MTGITLAVDIDETLAQTNLLWARHQLETYGNPEMLGAEDIIKKYLFVKNVPYWQCEEAHKWVEDQIQSSEAKLEIPVIEESILVMQRIPVACYLTNRPESTLGSTRKWLKKYGFPEREIVSSMKGLEGKAQKLADMFPAVSGIIDDNIDLLQYTEQHYKGKIFLYSHSTYGNSGLDTICCPTWSDVEREVQRFM